MREEDQFTKDMRRALLHMSQVLSLHGMDDHWCEVYIKIRPNKDGCDYEFIRVYQYMNDENTVKCVANNQYI